jgi:hypothetical protein
MRRFTKCAAALALSGALAVTAATPSQARHGRNAALIGGLAAGALIGAAAANASSGYYYGPGYYYEPDYAYEPAPVYVAPEPVYVVPRSYYRGCWHVTDSSRGYGYYGACN